MPSTQLVVSTVLGRVVPADVGNDEAVIVLDVLGHLRDRGRLEPQVELEPGRTVERLDHIGRPQPPQSTSTQRSASAAPRILALDIGAEARLDPGPQDLDRHVLAHAIGRPALPCAPARSRRRRSAARSRSGRRPARAAPPSAAPAPAPDRTAPSCPAAAPDPPPRRADDVGPRRQRLAELHIGRPEPVERRGADARPGRACARSAARTAARAGRRSASPAAAPSDRSPTARPRAPARSRRRAGGK